MLQHSRSYVLVLKIVIEAFVSSFRFFFESHSNAFVDARKSAIQKKKAISKKKDQGARFVYLLAFPIFPFAKPLVVQNRLGKETPKSYEVTN